MSNIQVTMELSPSVTQEQYVALQNTIKGMLMQYSHLIANFTVDGVPPSGVTVPVVVTLENTTPTDAFNLVQTKVAAAFANTPGVTVVTEAPQ